MLFSPPHPGFLKDRLGVIVPSNLDSAAMGEPQEIMGMEALCMLSASRK